MNIINLSKNDYEKCQYLRLLGYDVNKSATGCVLSSPKFKNLDQFMDVYYRKVDDVLLALRNDFKMIGYTIAA